jgi:anti-sigma regulatory factor (Ser/Thr protein kinase)
MRHDVGMPLARGSKQCREVSVKRAFDPKNDQAAESRRLVRSTLLSWGFAELVDDALQVTAELVANAQVGGPYIVTISHEAHPNSVHIAVQDGRPGIPIPQDAGPESETGRGLVIIAALADEWGYRDDLVWVRFKTHGKAATTDAQ